MDVSISTHECISHICDIYVCICIYVYICMNINVCVYIRSGNGKSKDLAQHAK